MGAFELVSIPYRFNESLPRLPISDSFTCVSIPYRFNERYAGIADAMANAVSIPYRFNESLGSGSTFAVRKLFQFLIGSMKVDRYGRGVRRCEFQFLIGSMKGLFVRRFSRLYIWFQFLIGSMKGLIIREKTIVV